MSADLDNAVRLEVYRSFVDQGKPPPAAEIAETLGIAEAEVGAALHRLEDGHVIVLAPGSLNIWMANPFCAVPTGFWVTTPRGSWWGTCIWDSLGIPAMLRVDSVIESACPDCS
jgi:hypothetical protein